MDKIHITTAGFLKEHSNPESKVFPKMQYGRLRNMNIEPDASSEWEYIMEFLAPLVDKGFSNEEILSTLVFEKEFIDRHFDSIRKQDEEEDTLSIERTWDEIIIEYINNY